MSGKIKSTNLSESTFTGKSTAGVNKALMQDLKTAAAELNMNLYFSSTTGGTHTTNSRHYSGNAVDIAAINGFSWNNGRSKFVELGDQLDAKLQSMGYTNDSEGKNPKSVLWKMNKYGNSNKDHEDHLHVSNLTDSIAADDGTIVVTPSSSDIETKIDTEEQTADSTVTNFQEVILYLRTNFAPVTFINLDTYTFNYNDEFITIHSNGTADIEHVQDKTKTTESWILNKTNGIYKLTIGSQVISPADNKLTKVANEAGEDDESWKVIDYIQLILDFAGFIPGYGDIIDAVNAMIYFAREKYIDGFLSLIAIIPFVGSVMKFGFKGAFKAIGAARVERAIVKALKGSPSSLRKILMDAAKSGKIDKLQLKQMSNFGDETAKLLRMKGKDLAKYEKTLKAMGTSPKAVMKKMDKWAKEIETLLVHRPDPTKAWKVGKRIAKGVDTTLTYVTFGGWNLLKTILKMLNIFNIGKMKQLENGVKAIYKEKLFASNMLAAQMAHVNEFIPSHFYKTRGWVVGGPSNNKIKKALDTLQKTNPRLYRKTIREIADKTAHTGNEWYRMMANNELMIAGTAIFQPGKVFKGTANGNLLNIFKEMNGLMNVKALDVYSNEIQDLAEKAGIDPQDDINGVIVHAIIGAMDWIMGDKDRKAGEQFDMNNVLSSSTQSEMKQIYDSTEGEPAERLEKMAASGYDELTLMAFSQIFKLF